MSGMRCNVSARRCTDSHRQDIVVPLRAFGALLVFVGEYPAFVHFGLESFERHLYDTTRTAHVGLYYLYPLLYRSCVLSRSRTQAAHRGHRDLVLVSGSFLLLTRV